MKKSFSVPATPGTNQMPGKSHDKVIAEGEGLPIGHSRSGKHKSTEDVKHNQSVIAKAHGFNIRSQSGNADPTGGCGE